MNLMHENENFLGDDLELHKEAKEDKQIEC